jgi:hypothetical protein
MTRNWEATLEAWVRPASENEEEKRDRTQQEISDAIRAHPKLAKEPIRIYAKGSYKNNTNVRLDSDVDINAEYYGFVYSDIHSSVQGLTKEDVGITPYTGDYSVDQFKSDLNEALVRAFGSSAVTPGNIAYRIREKKTTLPADVVPCFENWIIDGRNQYGSARYRQGVRIFPRRGSYINNWPTQHYENGVLKNDATGRRFKRIVRALKRLENELVDQGLLKSVPSYLIECLVYNVPNDRFGHPTYLADIRSALAVIFNGTLRDDACEDWEEVNGVKFLFRGNPSWTREQAHTFADKAWDYMGLE